MRRRLGAVVLAVLSAGCERGSVVDNTPPTVATPEPTPTPPPATPDPTPTAPPSPVPQATPPPPCDPPTVSIIRPSEGQTLRTSPQTINTNTGHSVTRVEFYYHIDSRFLAPTAFDPPVELGSKNAPPFRIEWRLPRECTASASLLAIAYNFCGDAAASDFVRVFICF